MKSTFKTWKGIEPALLTGDRFNKNKFFDMIQSGNTKIPEIELGAKRKSNSLYSMDSNSWLFGNPEKMNAYKMGCIQKCVGDFKNFREDEYKRFKGE
jgi:hypothetical protein